MKWLFWSLVAFVVAYLAALGIFLVGTYGWLGQQSDPLSGVFLFPLGLPWVIMVDSAGITGPTPVVLAPLINIAILLGLWRKFR